ncbi:MAG: SRPBCC domain-containing protein [Parvibaculaceae bacterium]
MTAPDDSNVRPDKLELVITRLLDAPPALVYKAWTEPEHMVRWLGPKGFTAPSARLDLRVGGHYRALIRSAEGKDYRFRGTYREVVENERLVFTFAWEEDGERGGENLVTVTFAEEGGKTRMTFRQVPFPSLEERDGHAGGWSEAFDKLGRYVAAMRPA